MSPSLLLILSVTCTLSQELKVLVSDGCVSLGDSSYKTSGGKEVSLTPEAPLVLTHQIHLSPAPGLGSCGCEGLSDLRLRIENLEKEVSVLRQRCGDPENPSSCSSSKDSKGFSGEDHSQSDCPGNCSNRGRCVGGVCECEPSFTGADCSLTSCPGGCSNRGRCVGGVCECEPSFTGADCSLTSCPDGCSNRGRCVDGKCECDPGFSGSSCTDKTCPGNCNSRGRCVNGQCICDSAFTGDDCGAESCPGNCNSRGRCVRGKCICSRGFSGDDCGRCQDGLTGDNCDTDMSSVEQLRTEDLTQSSVTVVWTQPPLQYQSYLLTFTSQKDDSSVQSHVPGSQSSFSQSGLAPGQIYTVTVTGVTGDRRGATATAEFTTMPDGPSDLRVVKSSTSSVVVQWEPSVSAVDRYRLTVSHNDNEGEDQELTFDPSTSSAHITQLKAGLRYDITLVAERGRSQSQAISTQATPGSADVLVAALAAPSSFERGEVKSTFENIPSKTQMPRANVTKVIRRIELYPSTGTDPGSEGSTGIDLTNPGRKTTCLNPVMVTHSRPALKDQKCRGTEETADGVLEVAQNNPRAPKTNQSNTDADVVIPDPLHKLLMDTFQNTNITAFDIRLSKPEPSNLDVDAETIARQIMQGAKPFSTKSSQNVPLVTSLFLLKSPNTTISPSSTMQTSTFISSDENWGANIEKKVSANYRRTQPNRTIIRRLRPNLPNFLNKKFKHENDSLPTLPTGRINSTLVQPKTSSLRDTHIIRLEDNVVSDGDTQHGGQNTRKGMAPVQSLSVNARFNAQNLSIGHFNNRFFRRPIRMQNQTKRAKPQSHDEVHFGHMDNLNKTDKPFNLTRAGFNRSRFAFLKSPNSDLEPFQNRTRLPMRLLQRGVIQRNWATESTQIEPKPEIREKIKLGMGTNPSTAENSNLDEIKNRLNIPNMLGRDIAVAQSNMNTSGFKERNDLNQSAVTAQLHSSYTEETKTQGVIAGEKVKESAQMLSVNQPQTSKNCDSSNVCTVNLKLEVTEAAKSGNGVRTDEAFVKQGRIEPSLVARLQALSTPEIIDHHYPNLQENLPNINDKQSNSHYKNRTFRRPYKPRTHPAQTRRRILSQDQVRNSSSRTGFKFNTMRTIPDESNTAKNNFKLVATNDSNILNEVENVLKNEKPTLPRGRMQQNQKILRRLQPNLGQFWKRMGQNLTESYGSLSSSSEINSLATVRPGFATEESTLSSKEATNLDKLRPSEAEIPHSKKTEESSLEEEGPGGSEAFAKAFPETNYKLTVLGRGSGVLTQLHKLVITTGPEPPSDLVFSHVTEDSVTVSWTRPKSKISGFKVTYTHAEDGEPVSVSLDQKNSSVALSRLTPGSEYEISILSVLGLDESDAITKTLYTLPDPPTDLRAVNVSDSGALLLWRPSLAAVDNYSIVYGAASGSEVRVTVSGNTAEKQLNGLEPSTTYSVTISSELDARKSREVETSFITTSGSYSPADLRATNVKPRSALLSWKPPSRPVIGYRVTYWTEGQRKEVSVGAMATQLNLTGLFPGSQYSVELQTDDRGEALTTTFTTGSLQFPFPSDCSQEQLNGLTESALVDIFPLGQQGPALSVWCDMDTDGGGWTVFQRRKDGSVDFFRTWKEYVQGFGDASGEFWLGLDALHTLTSRSSMTLRVDLSDGQNSVYALYSSFIIAKRNYRLTVGGYSGTAGDSMSYHNNGIFSTKDRDPGSFVTRCAMSYRGGWWYKNCHEANLNGLYGIASKHQGIIWTSWKGKEESIPFTEMKMRPTDFIANKNK